ncbi:MAG: Fic family protein [Acidimicrobiales bacterium]
MFGRLVQRTWQYDPTLYAPARYRKACRYEAFVPRTIADLSFDLPGSLVGVLSDAEHAIRSLNASARPALAPLARLLLRTESVASSKVEGMQVEARALARADARADVGAKVPSTTLEVLANIDAMALAVEEATVDTPVTIERIVDVNRALLAGSSKPDLAGRVRSVQNWIGGNDYNPCGAAFVPPPESELGELLADLCSFCDGEGLSPLVQAALAHAQFETIHPFIDGNGRTGRALVQVILRRRGLAPSYVPPISVVLAKEKPSYIEALTAYREGDLVFWLERFSVAAARAAALAEHYLADVGALQVHWRAQVSEMTRPPRADAVAWALLDLLPGQPVLTLPVAVAMSGRVKSAVNAAIAQLVDAGVLIPLSSNARNRVWEAAGLLDLLTAIDDP